MVSETGTLPKWAEPDWVPHRVLAPVDGSEQSERALRMALPFVRRLGAEVTMLAVIDVEDPAIFEGAPESFDPAIMARREASTRLAEQSRDAAISYMSAVATGLPGDIPSVRPEVRFGRPGDKILEMAEAERTDLIVMATRRESTLARGILGSVTSRVLHGSAVPMLVVRVDESHPITPDRWPSNILAPIDATPKSELSINAAITLAKITGATLRIMRVTPRVYYAAAAGAIEYAGSGIFFGAELRAEAFEYMAPMVDRARAQGVECYAEARSGSPERSIIDALHDLPDSLAVMTTHARAGLQRFTLGSVADKVVRTSGRPVLLLPPPGAAGQ